MTINNKIAAEALTAIADAEGRLTPNAVIKAAANPRHPLHDAFEWDDTKAGHAYRIDQARALIARVRIEVTETDIRIAYVRDPGAESESQGYRATAILADNKQQARLAVLAELYRVLTCLNRAVDVAQAVDIEADIQSLIGQTEQLIATIERPPRKKAKAPRKTTFVPVAPRTDRPEASL